jgi:hypothetical protein
MVVGKLDIYMQKVKTKSMSLPCTNINIMWMKDLNIRPEILKLVQVRVRNTLELVGIGNRTPVAQQFTERIDKCDCMRLRNFYRMKRD